MNIVGVTLNDGTMIPTAFAISGLPLQSGDIVRDGREAYRVYDDGQKLRLWNVTNKFNESVQEYMSIDDTDEYEEPFLAGNPRNGY